MAGVIRVFNSAWAPNTQYRPIAFNDGGPNAGVLTTNSSFRLVFSGITVRDDGICYGAGTNIGRKLVSCDSPNQTIDVTTWGWQGQGCSAYLAPAGNMDLRIYNTTSCVTLSQTHVTYEAVVGFESLNNKVLIALYQNRTSTGAGGAQTVLFQHQMDPCDFVQNGVYLNQKTTPGFGSVWAPTNNSFYSPGYGGQVTIKCPSGP